MGATRPFPRHKNKWRLFEPPLAFSTTFGKAVPMGVEIEAAGAGPLFPWVPVPSCRRNAVVETVTKEQTYGQIAFIE